MVYSLGVYSLGPPILDLGTHSPACLRLYSLGVYSLGVYSLGPPISDLVSHLPA